MTDNKYLQLAAILKLIDREQQQMAKHRTAAIAPGVTRKRQAVALESARICAIEARRLTHEAHCLAVEIGIADRRAPAAYAPVTAPAGMSREHRIELREPAADQSQATVKEPLTVHGKQDVANEVKQTDNKEREAFEAWYEDYLKTTWKPLPSDVAAGRVMPEDWGIAYRSRMAIAFQAGVAIAASQEKAEPFAACLSDAVNGGLSVMRIAQSDAVSAPVAAQASEPVAEWVSELRRAHEYLDQGKPFFSGRDCAELAELLLALDARATEQSSAEVVRNSERYLWLRDQTSTDEIAIVMKNKCINDLISYAENIDSYIDRALKSAPPQPAEQPSASYADCCDTPNYCSSVRRCTAKDDVEHAEQPSTSTDSVAQDSIVQWARSAGIKGSRKDGSFTESDCARLADFALAARRGASPAALTGLRGYQALRDAINNLRIYGLYEDDEGEETDALEQLADAIARAQGEQA